MHIYLPAPSTIDPGKSQGLLTPLLFQTAHESHATTLETHWEERERRGKAEVTSFYTFMKLIAAAMGRIKGLQRACVQFTGFCDYLLYTFFYIKNLNAYYFKIPKYIKEHYTLSDFPPAS